MEELAIARTHSFGSRGGRESRWPKDQSGLTSATITKILISDFRIEQAGGLFRVPLHFPADQIAQGEDHRVCDFIADGRAIAFPPDQMMIVQDGKMLGDVGLLHRTVFHQLADGQRPVVEGLQEGQTARFGKDGEEAGNRRELPG